MFFICFLFSSLVLKWVENLIYEGFSDWRLPTTRDDLSGAEFNARQEFLGIDQDGSSYFIYDIPALHNEFAFMYYENLNRLPFFWLYTTSFGNLFTPDVEICSVAVCPSETNEPFNNLFSAAYWTNLSSGFPGGEYFSFGEIVVPGKLSADYRGNTKFAWAVRNGDVLETPIPSTFLLFGSELLSLLGLKKSGNS